jgi:hypothetical protein
MWYYTICTAASRNAFIDRTELTTYVTETMVAVDTTA